MADENLIDIEEFARLDLRTGTILEATAVEGSDKLVLMKVDIGSEQRQVVAGIRLQYSPETLVGKRVVLVANLKKAKIRGIESEGMILAAGASGYLSLIGPDSDIENGARIR